MARKRKIEAASPYTVSHMGMVVVGYDAWKDGGVCGVAGEGPAGGDHALLETSGV